MITAPYNFVPLNEKVFYSPWADDVSHDIPFEDEQSGQIDITITAKSPIFVKDSENEEEFCNFDKKYYIPGSSVKGAIRSILEIMSFSKLREEEFTDSTYALRDLSSAKNFYMQQMSQQNHTTYCGWLKKEEDKYIIENCGIPGRIHHKQIDKALNTEFAKYFNSKLFSPKKQELKTAKYKYDLLKDKNLEISVSEKYFSEKNPKYDKREFYKYDKNGKNKRTLVLTGQPTLRQNTGKMGDGKGFEFLFFQKIEDLEVPKKVFENFKFAYFDDRDTEPKESPDWTYWKKKLKQGEKVPVFFQKTKKKVNHFGLSYLYKLPYKHSVKHALFTEHFSSNLDLAQSIFGYVDKQNQTALKSRVQFSNFLAQKDSVNVMQKRTEILGSPRASYYPNYIKQDGGVYKTYMDDDFKIAGRKRYPIHKGNKTVSSATSENENIGTTITPLKDGVVFKGKLRYHNLRKAELGAILSALTFHNTKDTFHNIGMAKALGYGKVKIETSCENLNSYLKEFELEMNDFIENWASSKELTELISMSVEQDNSRNSKLEYMELEKFAKVKNQTEILDYYTHLNNIKKVVCNSLLSNEDKEKFKQRKKLEIEKMEHSKKWSIIQNSENIALVENYIKEYQDKEYARIDEAKKLIEQIELKKQEEEKKQKEKETQEKWEAVQKVEEKFKKKALEDFISKNPEFSKIDEVKKQLDEFISNIEIEKNKSMDLSKLTSIKNVKNLKTFLSKVDKEELERNKPFIQEKIIELYPKNKKKFFNILQLKNIFNEDFEAKIKDILG